MGVVATEKVNGKPINGKTVNGSHLNGSTMDHNDGYYAQPSLLFFKESPRVPDPDLEKEMRQRNMELQRKWTEEVGMGQFLFVRRGLSNGRGGELNDGVYMEILTIRAISRINENEEQRSMLGKLYDDKALKTAISDIVQREFSRNPKPGVSRQTWETHIPLPGYESTSDTNKKEEALVSSVIESMMQHAFSVERMERLFASMERK